MNRNSPYTHRLNALMACSLLNGLGTGLLNTVVALEITNRFGLTAAGLALGTAMLGRILLMRFFVFVDSKLSTPDSYRAVFRQVVFGMVFSAVALSVAAAVAPLAVVIVLGVPASALNSLVSTLLQHQAGDRVENLPAVSMAGTAVGALVAVPLVSSVSHGSALILLLLLSQLFQVRTRNFTPPPSKAEAPKMQHTAFLRGLVLAGSSFGPLVIYAALVTHSSGSHLVGPTNLTFALGALAAPRVSRALPHRGSTAAALLFGAINAATWMYVGGSAISLLSLRFISGVTAFSAQGRLLSAAGDSPHPTSAILATSTGLAVGTGASSILAGTLADHLSVAQMGAVFALASIAASGVALMYSRLAPALSPMSHENSAPAAL